MFVVNTNKRQVVFKKNNARVTVLPAFERQLRSASFNARALNRHTDELMARRDIGAALRKRLGKFRAVKSTSGKMFILSPALLSARAEHTLLNYLYRHGVPVLRSIGYCKINGAEFVISELLGRRMVETAKAYLAKVKAHSDARQKRLAFAKLFGLAVGKLHNAGVEHEDLHLQNVLVRFNSGNFPTRVLLTDFRDVTPTRYNRPLGKSRRLSDLEYIFGVARDTGHPLSNEEQRKFLAAYSQRRAREFELHLREFMK